MREKHETDMKKEIKKLQRLREFFRQQISKGEIKDTSKLEQACTRIVSEMEEYREREKKLKDSKMSKAAMLQQNEREGKFNFGSDQGSEYGNEMSYGSDESGDGQEEIMETDSLSGDSLMRDKEWFTQIFIAEVLKVAIAY